MADPSLPAYADDSPYAAAPTDHKPAPQSVWIQDTDVSGTYRKRYILAADDPPTCPPPPPFDPSPPPPTYTTSPQPLYTIKSHGRGSPLDFRGPQPDITIYLGDGDSGPVVATGVLHTTPLKKSLGEVRFFPHPHSTAHASSSSSSAKDIPAITIKDRDAGKKYTFTHHAHTFTWVQTGPGERPPAPPPTTAPAPPPTTTGLLSKLKLRSAAPKAAPAPTPPALARDTKTWELHAADATKLATYTELQPVLTGPAYRASAPKFAGGHMARVDVHEPTFDVPGGGGGGVRELAVVSVMMMVEAQRRRIVNAANRGWLDSVGMQGGAAGGGGCGGM